jgi:NAD+ synthase (glutamine-hydrolysing)
MINISASPFDYTHDAERKTTIKANVLKYNLPIFYCNAVGSQTEVVFDGASMVFDKNANLCGQLPMFEEALESFTLQDDGLIDAAIIEQSSHLTDKNIIPTYLDEKRNIAQVHDAIVLGIRDYFSKMGFSKAIIGSSGGIDSAVTIALACTALGPENVRAILMPSQYSSDHSVADAEVLSKNLGNPYDIIPIKNIYDAFLSELNPIFNDLPFGLAEENIQSRSRGNLLMAIANKFGYILLNTSNKSELATGYGTLYGDMAGGIGVLGDCYKLQVYALANYINRNEIIIPSNIISFEDIYRLMRWNSENNITPEQLELSFLNSAFVFRKI